MKWKDQILVKGSTFMAYDHEVSPTFRDLIQPLSAVEAQEIKTEKKVLTDPFMERKAGAWWDVYGWEGEKVNGKSLKKEAAETLLQETIENKPTEE